MIPSYSQISPMLALLHYQFSHIVPYISFTFPHKLRIPEEIINNNQSIKNILI